MKVLLTGYSGFLGGHLGKILKNHGYDLRILMNRTTKPRNEIIKDADIIWGSIIDKEIISKAVDDVQIVVHSAWSFSDPFCERPTINETGAEILLKESVRAGVDKFAFISSVSVYGMEDRGDIPLNENAPLNLEEKKDFIYPSEKIHVEHFLKNYEDNNIQIGIFRPGPIFDDSKSPIKKIVQIRGRYFGIGMGNGRNIMPNIHASDVADAVVKWLEKGKSNVIYNVTPTKCMRVSDWYSSWGAVQGVTLHPFFIPIQFFRFAGFAANILKKLLNKNKSDVEYAIACATRNISYSNKALKNDLNWEDKETAKYTINKGNVGSITPI